MMDKQCVPRRTVRQPQDDLAWCSVFPAYRRITSAITSCQRLESVTCMATPVNFPNRCTRSMYNAPSLLRFSKSCATFQEVYLTVTFRYAFAAKASCSRWDGSGLDLDGEELLDRDIQHPGESNRPFKRRAVQAFRSSRSGQPGTKKFTPFRSDSGIHPAGHREGQGAGARRGPWPAAAARLRLGTESMTPPLSDRLKDVQRQIRGDGAQHRHVAERAAGGVGGGEQLPFADRQVSGRISRAAGPRSKGCGLRTSPAGPGPCSPPRSVPCTGAPAGLGAMTRTCTGP